MTNDFKPAKAGGNQPRLSKEEYAEKKRAEKEKVYQMIDDAAREIVSDPEKFKSFLDTQSRMDRYSAANALLIYSQYPQATQLKDFDDWGKDNVKITKGAKSISILEPVEYTRADGSPGISYNVKKVFDVTQTNGRKAPAVRKPLILIRSERVPEEAVTIPPIIRLVAESYLPLMRCVCSIISTLFYLSVGKDPLWILNMTL